ncbi:CDP-glucose 4,6-dehydratase [Anaeromicrobium sediminis]|uniref:CDP-glucose 4,6-dehydratase n=1 Tax=Anaeromicrobium sediminis TaxID=1478221 RepID=A0A267MMK3_9FIRM|nr:CDP-glucose 4,6-dehydratase [Anaeromicrobium sediminis]PAB60834.1 CDP-glucose 4,6-dehydratase [Anaeromicrobium sediminis]
MDINNKYSLKGFYRGKTVLVTGHTGFKGSWLSIWLKKLGAKVIGYGLDPYTTNGNFVVCNLENKMVDIRADIRDEEKLKYIFNKYKPEIVFHLAAQPLVRLSYKIPKETYDVNVIGSFNVLECIKNTNSVKVGVIITTDKCYKNKEQIWGYRETDPLGGYDPYSSSKACAEILIDSYRNSFINPNKYKEHGKAISSVRTGNVIGGGDWSKNRLIPDCIRSLYSNKKIEIRNPNSIRPWQHVLEPLYGYLLLGKQMYFHGVNYSGAWNFGPDFESIVTVETIVNTIIDKWGSGTWIDLSHKKEPHEATLLNLDCTKAKTYLHWKPKLNIEEALAYTVYWYKNYKNENIYKLCLDQINEYSK